MSPQVNYTTRFSPGWPGQISTTGKYSSKTTKVLEPMGYGLVNSFCDNSGNQARLPTANVIVLDVELSVSNVLAGNVKRADYSNAAHNVDPVVTTSAITRTFTTDHDTDMTAIAALIQALSGVLTCVQEGQKLIITADPNVVVTLDSWAVTGGSAVGVTYDTTDSFDGISCHVNRQANSSGVAQLLNKDNGDALHDGRINATIEQSVTVKSPVYVRIIDDTNGIYPRGSLRKDAGSPQVAVPWNNPNVKFVSDGTTTGAVIDYAEVSLKLS